MAEGGRINPNSVLEPADVKILVMGKSRSGKTSFIRAFYDQYRLGGVFSLNGAWVYPCGLLFAGQFRRIFIFEANYFPEYLISEHSDADGFILMYAVDDQSSLSEVLLLRRILLERLLEPVVVVGCKRDLRDDPLAVNAESFVRQYRSESFLKYTNVKYFSECSVYRLEEVHAAFMFILDFKFGNENIQNASESAEL